MILRQDRRKVRLGLEEIVEVVGNTLVTVSGERIKVPVSDPALELTVRVAKALRRGEVEEATRGLPLLA